MYEHCHDTLVNDYIQRTVLQPFRLNFESFFAKQKEMSLDFLMRITSKMEEAKFDFFNSNGVESIITGLDKVGEVYVPHIYTIIKSGRTDITVCQDAIGFAAIGAGARHAEMQFMLAGHHKFAEREDTLLLTLVAKKRSEIAPGVGKGTDMFTISPMDSFAVLRNIKGFEFEKLESIYDTFQRSQDKSFARAKEQTQNYINDFLSKQKTPPVQQNPSDAPPVK